VLKRDYESQTCSVARTLEVVGERWTLLIVRDAFLGVRRFEDFQRSLGIARNVLSDRLARLVEAGVLERRRYHERPPRDEYRLTEKGRELRTALVALKDWGDRHLAPNGPPRLVEHTGCGGAAVATLVCDGCGAELGPGDITSRPGPGAVAAAA
jgi:DNA-binding HxlR family transcriptional regulator